jgi:DNA-binding winged helix-turn-helix (wHTH) protein
MDGLGDNDFVYAFGPFGLDPRRRRLTRDGAELTVTPTVLDVLICLVRNAGRVVTKDELLDAVWPGRIVEEANVKQAVFTLRKALGPDGGGIIATAPGRGYRFTAELRVEPRTATIPPVALVARWRSRPARRSAYALLTLLLIVGIAVALFERRTTAPSEQGRTVVLSDFENRTGEAVFDHTLANLLRIDLSQSPFLNVLSERQAQQTLTLMRKPADTPVTPALAEEICTRNNGDAVIRGP